MVEIKRNRIFGGVLLIAGTAIGAGMLAMPIVSGKTGFYPALAILLAVWVYLTLTAFLFLEATLWLERDVNIVTMAEHTLGLSGKIIAWFVYLFLLYSLTAAYLSGCGAIFINTINAWSQITLPNWFGPIPFLLLFGLCVYLGTKPVDYINRTLMVGLVATFLTTVFVLLPKSQGCNLQHTDWAASYTATAIMVTSFGFHIIIPSLGYYLGYRKKALVKTIAIGSIIPLVIYIFWLSITLGIVPYQGPHGIAALATSSHPEVELINTIAKNTPHLDIIEILRFFTYFAILSSFLGVSLSLSDFLADGFKIEKNYRGRFLIALMTFLPPLVFSLLFPNVFINALKYGALFIAILLGIFPALMVWSGRYRMKLENKFRVFGGKALLLIVILVSIAIIVVDCIDQFSF